VVQAVAVVIMQLELLELLLRAMQVVAVLET
jgi:hypothetical protein